MTETVTIIVRYTGHTYVARCRGQKPTASCVYDPALAAKALAGKLGLEEGSLEKVAGNGDYLEFTARQKAETESPA